MTLIWDAERWDWRSCPRWCTQLMACVLKQGDWQIRKRGCLALCGDDQSFLPPHPPCPNNLRITDMISWAITVCLGKNMKQYLFAPYMSNNVLVRSQVSLSLNNLSSHGCWACNMATKMYLKGLLTSRLFWNLRHNQLVSFWTERYTVGFVVRVWHSLSLQRDISS